MAANVESMFYVREKPWHGLGTMVAEAPDSAAALRLAGLDWNVVQKDIMTVDGSGAIPGFKANVRDTDGSVLGIVTDRYRVVQNAEAFSFTDELLGEGVRYETAGSLQGGRRTWVLARLPHQYIINGEEITPYLVFMNAHDGSGAIKATMTPIRVVCQNTLNLALSTAKRSWSFNHTGDISGKEKEDIFRSSYEIGIHVNLYGILTAYADSLQKGIIRRLLNLKSGILGSLYWEWLTREDCFYDGLRPYACRELQAVSELGGLDCREEDVDGTGLDKAA